MNYSTLLSPFPLGIDQLKNRLVMPPMVTWRAGRDGQVTDDHLDHYRESGGAGITIVEATAVSPEGRLAATELGLFDDAQIPGMTELADTITATGSLPGIQLVHAGGRTKTSRTYGLEPLVVSKTEELSTARSDSKRELSDEDIRRIIGDFSAAARRAVGAGFKLIELHGAHGYLGSQFLSSRTNRRRDGWGGSFEKRLRFFVELVRAVRVAVGSGVHLSVRLGVAEGAEDGLPLSEGLRAAEILCRTGLDLIHVSHAGSVPPAPDPESPYEALLQLAKPVGKRVAVPVIGIGGIKTPQQADQALEDDMCDLVAVGRGILADPGWARKTIEGRPDDIAICEDCRPRCFHFTEPERCPARNRLAAAGT
jgi:NADPH2 dehydrogenase